LVEILKENGIVLDELVAYKTSCKKSTKVLEDNSIFIFTSPSSVECFFNQYSWKDSYKAIVIGKTTAVYLPKEVEYTISSTTSVDECVNLAKQSFF
jgi:uroporphyrinogen-III synthase